MTNDDVIRGLLCCISDERNVCNECPYFLHKGCTDDLLADTILFGGFLNGQSELKGLFKHDGTLSVIKKS